MPRHGPARRRRARPHPGALLLLIPALVVAGCGFFQPEEIRPCPRVSVLDDAGRAVQYRDGAGRDLTDVTYQARIDDVQSSCSYDKQELTVNATVIILAQRGPASRGAEANFPFFVAVTDRDQNILAKEVFDSVVEFPEGRRRAGVFEEVEQQIALRDEETGDDYEIIVGFQLSRDQLDRNRARRTF